jgi:hypothetical protein
MAAYLIVDTLLDDPDLYEEYKLKARPLIERFGGQYLARGHPAAWCSSSFRMLKPQIGASTRSNISKSFRSARNRRAGPRLFWRASKL